MEQKNIELGHYQDMEVRRMSDYGAYLALPGEDVEVLLPTRYVTDEMSIGTIINVFVYKDSEDRPVATTEKPFAIVGEFAYLEVKAVNDVGAFLDWGLAKDLLVPFSEQKARMRKGGTYLVYIYIDKTTGRIVASSKIERFLGNAYPDYKVGQQVDALVIEQTPIGYKTIVNNLHRGMIYSNEIYQAIEIEQNIRAYVKRVREDGKIDLTLNDRSERRTSVLAEKILKYLNSKSTPISEKMTPEQIELLFACSKKDFKKAVGHLYKERKVTINPDGNICAITGV